MQGVQSNSNGEVESRVKPVSEHSHIPLIRGDGAAKGSKDRVIDLHTAGNTP